MVLFTDQAKTSIDEKGRTSFPREFRRQLPEEEGRKLAERKKKLYAEYRKAKADMQEVTTIKANIDYLLGVTDGQRKKEQER